MCFDDPKWFLHQKKKMSGISDRRRSSDTPYMEHRPINPDGLNDLGIDPGRKSVLLDHLRQDNETLDQNPNPNIEDGTLSQLISDLRRKFNGGDPSVSKVKRPQMLIDALIDMNNMIGMDRLKEAVSLQVMRLIDALNSGQTNLGMLNTILYGDPGVGKTKVGINLAKIWYALGFLDENAKVDQSWFNGFSDIPENELNMFVFAALIGGSYLWASIKMIYSNFGFKWLCIILILTIIIILAIWWWWTRKANYEPKYDIDKKIDPIDALNGVQQPEISSNGVTNGGSEELDRKIIKVVSRVDFIEQYVGQSAPKTKKLLQANLGKVLFIDEAYSLLNDERDPYGMEALTTLNLFLSENEGKIVVIFAGYKDLMQNGIFHVQPGLPRRCMWHFECDGYSGDQLGQIFMLQLKEQGWNVANETAVLRAISQNKEFFPSYGGDTKRLIFFAQLAASKHRFYSQGRSENILTTEDVIEGIRFLQENNIHKDRPRRLSSLQAMSEIYRNLPTENEPRTAHHPGMQNESNPMPENARAMREIIDNLPDP